MNLQNGILFALSLVTSLTIGSKSTLLVGAHHLKVLPPPPPPQAQVELIPEVSAEILNASVSAEIKIPESDPHKPRFWRWSYSPIHKLLFFVIIFLQHDNQPSIS